MVAGISSRGYALIEAVIAAALTLAVVAIVVALVELGRASFAVQSEAADMQQRLRVAAGALYRDLTMAGAGVSRGANTGPLVHYFAPVLPYRQGTNRDDPPGTFKTDTITLMYVPQTMAQTTLAGAGSADVSASVSINQGPGCPLLDPLCGFRTGMTMLVYDSSGDYDTLKITGTQPPGSSGVDVAPTRGVLTHAAYVPNTTTLAEVTSIVYYLKSDAATGVSQLVSREGATGSDVPLVDHLVGLRFDYYGDPTPPALVGAPLAGAGERRTTFGPSPPASLDQIPTGGYPPGENCTFAVDPAAGVHVSRLPALVADDEATGLVRLTEAQLSDGPWCPDATNPNRWDADLLRIRTIAVTLRLEAAAGALRGPAGILFTNGGTARSGTRWLPDQTIRFQVTPRNLAVRK